MTPVVERVAFDHPDARALREAVGAEMAALYGRPRHGLPGEEIDPASILVTLLVRDDDGTALATASLRTLRADVEAKRLAVTPAARGRGLSSLLMDELEAEAAARGFRRLLIHTGERQTAALALYRGRGYRPIEVFDPYLDVPESVCFEKVLDTDRG